MFVAGLFLTFPALAEPQFGISMHGEPKYESTDTHLTYANPNAPKGGNVTIAAIGTFDTINPYSIKGKAAQGLNLVYDRLMARVWDEPFAMYPLIAQSYEMPEDRSRITFNLNPAARFHDGSPITAQDVLFSFETLKESGRPNMRRVYRLVETANITQEQSITFTFGEGYDRETALIIAMMPVLSRSYWQDKTFDSTTLAPINTNGPYRIKNIDPGRSITYERVKDYWAAETLTRRGHFNLDEITYEYFRDDGVSFEAFTSGAYDLRRESDITKWAQGYNIPAVEAGEIIKETLPHARPERTRGLIFNTRRDIFADPKVREALTLPFDSDWMNENFFFGQCNRINSYFPNSEFAANTAPPAPFNLRQALRNADALLTEAGWTVENGKRMKDGQEFSFEILLAAPEQEKIALHYKQTLERLGITLQIRIADDAAFRGRLNEYDYDMVAYHWQSSLSPGTEQVLYWGCEAANQPGRFNYAGICDPEIDSITQSIANTTSRKDLVTAMQNLDAKLMAGHYMIPLFYADQDFVAYNAALKRPSETPLYGMVFESWWKESD